MADEDDLDAFFDDVSEVEAKVVTAEEIGLDDDSTNRITEKRRHDEIHEDNEDPSAKKQKIGQQVPPPRPRGVVVAAASVRTTTNSAISNLSSKNRNEPVIPIPGFRYDDSTQYMPYGDMMSPPPPPPPPPPSIFVPFPGSNSDYPGPSSGGISMNNANATKKAPIVRTAAGKVWIDESLADWPDDDFRIFVGNLDPAVTDQQLIQHFASKYTSVARAKIVRDPHKKIHHQNNMNQQQQQAGMQQQQQQQQAIGVSKGYGFVSLTNALECAKAIREMDQTWLGSRPIRVKRSHWKDRDFKERKKKEEKVTKQKKKFGLL